MNIFLWVLQIALAFLYVAGGAYKTLKPEEVGKFVRSIPRGGWRALGVLEVMGGVLLVIPAVTAWAAAVLAIETLALAVVYARRSLKLTAANPLVWAAVMRLLVLIVAYARWGL